MFPSSSPACCMVHRQLASSQIIPTSSTAKYARILLHKGTATCCSHLITPSHYLLQSSKKNLNLRLCTVPSSTPRSTRAHLCWERPEQTGVEKVGITVQGATRRERARLEGCGPECRRTCPTCSFPEAFPSLTPTWWWRHPSRRKNGTLEVKTAPPDWSAPPPSQLNGRR